MGHHRRLPFTRHPHRQSWVETLLTIGETTGLSVAADLRARELEARRLGTSTLATGVLDPAESTDDDHSDINASSRDD